MEKISSFVGSFFGSGGGEAHGASLLTQSERGSSNTTVPDAKVSSIFIYPIKSCRGISVPQATITSSGFRWDRQWVIVNSKGRACTQRVEPKLALIDVELPKDAFKEDWVPTPESYLGEVILLAKSSLSYCFATLKGTKDITKEMFVVKLLDKAS